MKPNRSDVYGYPQDNFNNPFKITQTRYNLEYWHSGRIQETVIHNAVASVCFSRASKLKTSTHRSGKFILRAVTAVSRYKFRDR